MISGLKLAGVLALGMGILGSMMLPSEAGDYRGGNASFIHRGGHGGYFGNRGSRFDGYGFRSAGRGRDFRNDHAGFGRDHGRWQGGSGYQHFANHPRRLQELASGNFFTRRGSGITVQSINRPDFSRISNDAGASDSFSTAAGTYSFGYTGYRRESAAPVLAPKAKIIDIATMKNACAYENGVCVIRP